MPYRKGFSYSKTKRFCENKIEVKKDLLHITEQQGNHRKGKFTCVDIQRAMVKHIL